MNQETNKFKLILMIAFGFFVLLGLVSFATYKSSSSTSSDVTITIWGTLDKTTFDNFVSAYKESSGTDLNLTYVYKSLSTIDSALVEAIATGKGPDAILIPNSLEKRYLDKVYLITSIPERTYKDTFVQEADLYIQPGGMFALPFFVDPLVMYWNRDMYSNVGIAVPPTTWAEFPSLAANLSKSDSNANITKSAVSLGEFTNINNAKALLSALILQAGSSIVSEDSSGAFTSTLNSKSSSDLVTPAVSVLNFFTDYSNPKKTVYSWNRSMSSSKQSFLGEDLATYFGFASEYSDIKEKNPNLNFDVAVIPQVVNAKSKSTYGDIYGFSILKSSQNALQAFNVLSSLVSADAITSFLKLVDAAPARRDVITTGSTDPAKTVFYNSALIAKGWIDPSSKETDQIFQDMVENISTGRVGVDESVSQASAELSNLLK